MILHGRFMQKSTTLTMSARMSCPVYANSAPLDDCWKRGLRERRWQAVSAAPEGRQTATRSVNRIHQITNHGRMVVEWFSIRLNRPSTTRTPYGHNDRKDDTSKWVSETRSASDAGSVLNDDGRFRRSRLKTISSGRSLTIKTPPPGGATTTHTRDPCHVDGFELAALALFSF
jgi:hypothetical protein